LPGPRDFGPYGRNYLCVKKVFTPISRFQFEQQQRVPLCPARSGHRARAAQWHCLELPGLSAFCHELEHELILALSVLRESFGWLVCEMLPG
jgi:hypothetical protein